MTLGLLDLSIVTDRLIDHLKACVRASQLWVDDPGSAPTFSWTGLAPDAARAEDGCQVSVYLFHVAPDKFYRNTFPTGGSAQKIPEQPLALTLYYLVTAHSSKSYIAEQQAMSIALKCFHEHSSISATVPPGDRSEEFTLTLEPQTIDETGRLWQSISSPMRLSAVYRASVIFIEPPPPKAPKPVLKAPDFKRPHEVEAFEIIPGSIELTATASATGLATIIITDRSFTGFVVGGTEARIRALPLEATTNSPLTPGQFRVVSPTTLEVQIPQSTPPGRYLLSVRPDAGKPLMEIWLDVP